MDKIIQPMNFVRSTKGTHFYEAPVPETARVKTLYIQKTAFGGVTPPAKIEVSVTVLE